MFRDIVLQDTTAAEWPQIRARIDRRVMSSMGTFPEARVEPGVEVLDAYEKYGLRHVKVRYPVMPGEQGLAVIVLPDGADEKRPAPAVLTIHGTNPEKGKWGMLDPEGPKYRAYAIDLARRGFVTVSADQFCFGELLTRGETLDPDALRERYQNAMAQFAERFPDWSLDGKRLWDHQRLLDALETLPYIAKRGFGAIGNSLGGRTVMYLAALETRITVAVPSCGISPNLTNVWRSVPSKREWKLSPNWEAYFLRNGGQMLFDYQDMIALTAPRALLVLEPYTDGLNTYMDANFNCYVRGQKAYSLIGKPECFATITHGDGHGIPPDVREFAYRWFERFLGK
ncbi:MAG: hypothetical protein JXR37_08980 [Kiritimatiellae bacterium]|nr:hypothetical protein [Kiritimatiellia bacterium]